ncbi:MAG: alkaline phosphatase family protein [Thermocladium sp.]
MLAPRYDGENLVNLSSSILKAFGAQEKTNPLNGVELHGNRIILILVDALGWVGLEKMSGIDDVKWFLEKSRQLTSVFPSVTATALTSLSTGVTPGIHGVLGTILFMNEFGSMINTLNMSIAPSGSRDDVLNLGHDLGQLYHDDTIFEEVGEHGIKSAVVVPKGIGGSGISHILYKGANVLEYHTLFDAFTTSLNALDTHQFVYLYLTHLDTIQHTYGPSSHHYEYALVETMHILRRFSEKLPSNVSLIITADHGQIDVGPEKVVDLRKHNELLKSLSVPPFGEPRALQLKLIDKSYVDPIRDYFKKFLPMVDLYDLNQVEPLLGGLSEKVRRRIGDLIAVPRDSTTLIYLLKPSDDKLMKFRGHHAGLSREEMAIPLFIINK